MKSPICEIPGIEFPLLAFSHCRDVVAAVTRAGGMGVSGAVNLPHDRLREELTWIDQHSRGKPHGVDMIVPNTIEGKSSKFSRDALLAAMPQGHKVSLTASSGSKVSTPAISTKSASAAPASPATCALMAPPILSKSRSSFPSASSPTHSACPRR